MEKQRFLEKIISKSLGQDAQALVFLSIAGVQMPAKTSKPRGMRVSLPSLGSSGDSFPTEHLVIMFDGLHSLIYQGSIVKFNFQASGGQPWQPGLQLLIYPR